MVLQNPQTTAELAVSSQSEPLPPLLNQFAWQHRPPGRQPAILYLGNLAEGSKRTMREALFTLLQLLLPEVALAEPAVAIATFPWEKLRFEHTSLLRAKLAERYKYSTVNKHLSALKGVLKAAWQLELLSAEDYQRAIHVKSIRGEALPVGRSLKEGELRALLLACRADPTIKGCRDLALIALLFATGLRREEVTLLTIHDYDRDTHALRIQGKGRKERLVYVEAPGAYEALHIWLHMRGDAPGPLFPRIRRGGHLVKACHPKGITSYEEGNAAKECLDGQEEGKLALQPLTTQGIYTIVLGRVEKAGILQLSTHDFRRNFIGELLDNGVDLSIAQKLAGHASPVTTARYDRRPEATKKRAAGTLHVPLIHWQVTSFQHDANG